MKFHVALTLIGLGCGRPTSESSVALSQHDAGLPEASPQLDGGDGVQADNAPAPVRTEVVVPPAPGAAERIQRLSTWADAVMIGTVDHFEAFEIDDPPYVKTRVYFTNAVQVRGAIPPYYAVDGGRGVHRTIVAPHSPPFDVGKTFVVFARSAQVIVIFPVTADSVGIFGETLPLADVISTVTLTGASF